MISRLARFRPAVPVARRLSTAAADAAVKPVRFAATRDFMSRHRLKLGAGFVSAGTTAQYAYGSAEDFFDFRFVTNKNPNDLAEFYGSEDFMEIFCVFPFVVEFMMKQGEFAADALPGYDQTVNTFGISGPGGMEVSMAFDEGEAEDNGEIVAYFNKRERFKDWAPFLPKYLGVVLWDLTQNFGYHRRADGTCEVYHHGEVFYGPFPIRIIFTCHAAYVAWATRRYIERPEFGNIDKADENHHNRQNIPKAAFDEFLAGLTTSVEKEKAEAMAKGAPVAKHEETLKKLKEARTMKLKTYATVSAKGDAQSVKLEVENPEVQKTIHTALAQIGEGEGKQEAPRKALEQLLSASNVLSVSKPELKPKPLEKKLMRRQSSLAAIDLLEKGAEKRIEIAKDGGRK